jgi:TonB family protein
MGLDEQAIEAVKQWQFHPAIAPDGRPVASEVTIQVDFRLLWANAAPRSVGTVASFC